MILIHLCAQRSAVLCTSIANVAYTAWTMPVLNSRKNDHCHTSLKAGGIRSCGVGYLWVAFFHYLTPPSSLIHPTSLSYGKSDVVSEGDGDGEKLLTQIPLYILLPRGTKPY
ncbi:hypothetical protein EV361DRAFT_93379 [Lentinula raphanica]|nr:hypothetical protein EV361DRAFT_93379 [Lentinula raphanica]